jgi:FkbM family methyltransferase
LPKINFKNNTINFWKTVLYSKKNNIPGHTVLTQAYEEGLLVEDNKKLLFNFIDYIKNFENDFKSQLYQDLFASFIVSNNFDKTFLEFGATNGVDLSNTYTLENNFSWSGALAEPDVNWIDSLKKNRAKSKIITKCIWSKSGEKMNFFSSKVGVLSTLDQFKNSDIKSMPGNSAQRNKEGVNIEVETISLNQVIEEEFNNKSPSYISIDTEGSEFEILNSFNFLKYHPVVFTIEHNFTDLQQKIDQLMLDNNYVRIFRELTAFDAWYISSKALDKLG